MASLLTTADRLLRGMDVRDGEARPQRSWSATLLCLCAFGMLYGAMMGTFTGMAPGRWMQMVYSAIKVPLLLLATFAISLPSFCVLTTLLGLRRDLGRAVGAIVSSQAVLTVVLASLAPVTLLWYVSSPRYEGAILFNAVMFGIAAMGAQRALHRSYAPLIASDRRHRSLLRVWLATYAFVGVQMGWLLRPFIGAPQHPPSLFREGAWDNAYEIVARMAWRFLTGTE